MKISELQGRPQWLRDADTRDADVDVLANGWVIWRGGDFRGGDFWGGDFWGGNFLGGNFLGGNFLGGNFLGGNFLGGNFLGDNFLGGKVGPNHLAGIWLHTITHCEGWPKTLYVADGIARILAGCRDFTLAEAKRHWAAREDRKMTMAAMLMASEIVRQHGWSEND